MSVASVMQWKRGSIVLLQQFELEHQSKMKSKLKLKFHIKMENVIKCDPHRLISYEL